MSFGQVAGPGLGPEGRRNQVEGCLDVFTSPMPVTTTEISLDIGSPSFLFVTDSSKVGDFAGIARPTKVVGQTAVRMIFSVS